MCAYAFVCIFMYVCACMCVWERERERESQIPGVYFANNYVCAYVMLYLDNKQEIELQTTIMVNNLLHSIVDAEQVIKFV